MPTLYSTDLREEELKLRVAKDFFSLYDTTHIAEAGTATQVTGSGANKTGVSNQTKVWRENKERFGLGIRELYVQFLIRIYQEIQGATLAEFSTLKILQGSAFTDFRKIFRARLLRAFAVPANTFDNVKGQFPIGFFIWDLNPDSKSKDLPTNSYRDTYRILKGYDSSEGLLSFTSKDVSDNCQAQECLTTKAQAVLDAGLAVYKYYHQVRKQRGGELNASLYDIKLYFKGRNEKGNMNATSQDEHFNTLMDNLPSPYKPSTNKWNPKYINTAFFTEILVIGMI